MPSPQDLTWYASQSWVTTPGELASLLDDLPNEIDGLREIAHGLVIHYRVDRPLDLGIPEQRLADIDSRYGARMLSRLAELQDGSLLMARPATQRLVGCCRDFTVLLLMMARARSIPARGRVGFARYFVANLGLDHEVAEVWDQEQSRWRLVDAELEHDHVDPTDGLKIDPLDVPRDRFLIAGRAWQQCRAGDTDPETFMVDPGLDLDATRSWPYLQHNLIHDLAALNKAEMLLWDAWGLADERSTTQPDLDLLDRIARITARRDPTLHELRDLYNANPRVQVPPTVTSYNPLGGPPRDIALKGLAPNAA
ncbi:MAG: transglutaminase-like domain-containing protein [Solirubrobacteraceae bacterium]